MAIYHCSIKNIGRSSGKSAIAASAYRTGEKLEDLETGLIHDYTKKSGIEYTEIILCKNARKEYKDRATLWNEVQKVEKASDARLAREWEVAIPRELSLEQGQKLVHDFGKSLADEGMCVDIAIHDKGDGNRHAHIMGTTRAIKENGEWAAKEKKVYALDDNGERIPIIDKNTGMQKVDGRNRKQWKRETIEANDWNKKEKVEEWRERWAKQCNHYLQQEKHINHRSYKRQGVEQIATIHEGYIARQIEQRGEVSEVCQINRDIKKYNELTKEQSIIERLIDKLVKEVKQLYERLARIKSGRGTDERVGKQASRPGEDEERSVRERLASIKSSEKNIGDFINKLNADERASEKERDNKIFEREDRNAKRERQSALGEREAKGDEREVRAERKAINERDRIKGPSL